DIAAGNLAGRVILLAVFDREGEEVAEGLRARAYGAKHHGVAEADQYGAAGLLGDSAGLKGDDFAVGQGDVYGLFCHGIFFAPGMRGPRRARLVCKGNDEEKRISGAVRGS